MTDPVDLEAIDATLTAMASEIRELRAERERLEGVIALWGGDAEGSETCRICGRFNGIIWHAPDRLWIELNGRYGGLMCPRCFTGVAREKGILLTWVPMVNRRDGVMTTNWWGDPVRDRLMMGEPDPHFFDDELVQVPQGHWGAIAVALGWSYETPYPDENRVDTMPGVVYRDSGVNREAEEYRAALTTEGPEQ